MAASQSINPPFLTNRPANETTDIDGSKVCPKRRAIAKFSLENQAEEMIALFMFRMIYSEPTAPSLVLPTH